MDEEDFREAEESRQLQSASDFAGFGTEDDEKRKGAFMEIFRPLEETVGFKLLKRMGWKEGQGIGPRVRRTANLADEGEEKKNNGPSDSTHLFAPDDVPMISFSHKTDRKGLGYEGELAAETDARKPSSIHAPQPGPDEGRDGNGLSLGSKLTRRGKTSAFGVGVLNEDGSDEDDPYSMGPQISYSRTIGGDKKPTKKAASIAGSANPLLKNKPVFVSKKLSALKGGFRKCHDGRLPLDGFVLGHDLDSFSNMSLQEYTPPEIPQGWKSAREKDSEKGQESSFISTADAAKSSKLDAKSRASLLGEAQLPGKSIFDFLSPEARHRLVQATGKSNLPPALNERPALGDEAPPRQQSKEALQRLVPQLSHDVALQALKRGTSGWMPYAEDEKKRSRYRTFLEIRAGLRTSSQGDEIPPRAENMSQDDWLVELNEFARAAQVFQPVTGLMASRFTSSSSSPHPSSTATGESATTTELLTKPTAKPEDPAESAAKMGMFGAMTRSTSNFYPTRLLCKRFNVPLPDHSHSGPPLQPGHAESTGAAKGPARNFQSAGFQYHDNLAANMSGSKAVPPSPVSLATDTRSPRASVDFDLSNAPTKVDPDRNEALEQEKPGEAVFKAIFGSDDDGDDD